MSIWIGIDAFLAVATEGNFTKAAQSLHVSTSHVSRQVDGLEERLGVRLFKRTTRKVQLTEAGELYLSHCSDIQNRLVDINSRIMGEREEPRGLIRISAAGPFAERFIAPLCVAFMVQHEHVSIDLDFSPRLIDLIGEGYDLAVRFGAPRDSSLVARKLAPRHMVVAGSPDYLAVHGTPLQPEDLREHQCLLGNFDRWRFAGPEGPREIRVTGRLRGRNTVQSLVGAALRGLGLVMFPRYHMRDYLDQGLLVQVLSEYMVQDMATWLVYPHRRFMPKRVSLLVDFLMDGFQNWDESGVAGL